MKTKWKQKLHQAKIAYMSKKIDRLRKYLEEAEDKFENLVLNKPYKNDSVLK